MLCVIGMDADEFAEHGARKNTRLKIFIQSGNRSCNSQTVSDNQITVYSSQISIFNSLITVDFLWMFNNIVKFNDVTSISFFNFPHYTPNLNKTMPHRKLGKILTSII